MSKKIVEKVIVDKYQHLIDLAKAGNITGKYTYDQIFDILRITERKIGKTIPTNLSCDECLIELILLYDRYLK